MEILTRPVSRRFALAALGAGGLAISLPNVVAAQEATPVQAVPGGDHLIVGAWLLQNEPVPGEPWVATFSTNGIFIEYMPDPGPPDIGLGIGVWLAVGPRSVGVMSNSQALALKPDLEVFREMLDLDYVPQPHEFQSIVVGFRQTFQIRADENHLFVTGSMEVRDGNGAIIAGPFPTGNASGVRLVPVA